MKTGILIELIPLLLIPAILLNACTNEDGSPVTPAADRPTFFYFFTDG